MSRTRYVSIQIELNDIETDDLIYELGERYLKLKQKQEVLENIGSDVIILPQTYLDDKLKVELFLKVMGNYSYQQLYEMLEYQPISAGKNQLQFSELCNSQQP